MTIYTITEDFLTMDFKGKKFDVIVMNPPWTNLGIKFIAKAVSLLEPRGRLVCIMGLDQLSPMNYKMAFDPGTFWWLNQKGNFIKIETSRHDGAYGTQKPFFNNGSSCWFIWENKPNKGITIINNKLEEEFDFELTGDEWMIPEEPFDIIGNYVDWGPNALIFRSSDNIQTQNLVEFKITLDEFKDMSTTTSGARGCIRCKIPGTIVDINKVKKFLAEDKDSRKRTQALYSRHIVSRLRHYPLRNDLFK